MNKKIKAGIFIFLISIVGLFLICIINNYSYALENNNSESIKITSKLSIDKKIGMNGHIDVPKDILLAGSVVREYHNFGWSITENKKMFFKRFSYWDFDGYYKYLSENGITILPCIQMGEQKVFNRNRNEKPVMKGDSTTDPMSYKIHSNYLFNYAARFPFYSKIETKEKKYIFLEDGNVKEVDEDIDEQVDNFMEEFVNEGRRVKINDCFGVIINGHLFKANKDKIRNYGVECNKVEENKVLVKKR